MNLLSGLAFRPTLVKREWTVRELNVFEKSLNDPFTINNKALYRAFLASIANRAIFKRVLLFNRNVFSFGSDLF